MGVGARNDVNNPWETKWGPGKGNKVDEGTRTEQSQRNPSNGKKQSRAQDLSSVARSKQTQKGTDGQVLLSFAQVNWHSNSKATV